MRIAILSAALLALAAATGSASAQSLELRKMRAAEEAKLTTALALTNRKCGTEIKARILWPSFDEAETLKTAVAPFCQAALDAIEDLCGDDMGKAAVKEKIRSVACGGAAEPAADLADGEVGFHLALKPNQNKLLVRGVLEKKL